jgi:DNA ligase 1
MNDLFDTTRKIEYPTLYGRGETGAVLEWNIIVEGDSFFTITGQQTGKKIQSKSTSCLGKNSGKANETTPHQQAIAEADAKWKKKIKNGYWEDVNDIDKASFFQVTLAKNFKDYRDDLDWSSGVGVQIKYNGGRILATKDGLFTRKGERYFSIPHIEEGLKPFFAKFPNAILDGEGFNYGLREKLNEMMKLLRKTVHITESDLEQSKDLIRFYIYDGYGFPATKDGVNTTRTDGYLKRKEAINNAFFAPCFADRYKNIIGEVPTYIVYSEDELNRLYLKFLDDKQEGAILRILDQPYENKRSKFLLKYKPIDDSEFKIISVNEGVGKFSNRVSTFTCKRIDGKLFDDGTDTFDATFKGEESTAIELWKVKDKFLNQIVTIHYNGLTGKGKPNYGRLDYKNYMHDK